MYKESYKKESDMTVSMDKEYTSDGRPIRLLCTDRNNWVYPVVGLCEDGNILLFTEDGRALDGSQYDLVEVEKLEPNIGDWCWFWDSDEHDGAVLSKLYQTHSDGTFQSWNRIHWENCSKFDGELPPHLNKNK
jgi:hypothetical protein